MCRGVEVRKAVDQWTRIPTEQLEQELAAVDKSVVPRGFRELWEMTMNPNIGASIITYTILRGSLF